MNGQGKRVFDVAGGELSDVLESLSALVPAAAVVGVEDGLLYMLTTVGAGGVRATVEVEAESLGQTAVLRLAELREVVAVSGPPSAGDAETRVTIARARARAIVGTRARARSREVEVTVGGRPHRLAMGEVAPRVAKHGPDVSRTSRPGFLRVLRSVRAAAYAANADEPVVTVTLTAAGLTFGAGRGGNVTLDTTPVRVDDVTVDRVAVLPLAPLEAFAARMPHEVVRVSGPLGDEGWVTFSCGRLSLSLRQLVAEDRAVLADAVAARYDRLDARGRVIVDRARLATALVEEAQWLEVSGFKPGTIVLRVGKDGTLSAISPERRAIAGTRPWQRAVEVKGRSALTDVELHCDLVALRTALLEREHDGTNPGEGLVAIHVTGEGPLVVTLPGCEVDDVAVRRDGVACTATAGAWLVLAGEVNHPARVPVKRPKAPDRHPRGTVRGRGQLHARVRRADLDTREQR